MKQFVCKPTIHMFPTCKDFLAGFDIGEEDLVLSNRARASRHVPPVLEPRAAPRAQSSHRSHGAR